MSIAHQQSMEFLIKQTRSRFSGTRIEDNKLQPQKTQSFKDKKSWIKRQFSRQMSWDNDSSSFDYPTAVAAAAYAVHSQLQQESKSSSFNRTTDDKATPKSSSFNRAKTPPEPEPLKSALKYPDEASRASFKESEGKQPDRASSLRKKISFADTHEIIYNGKKPESEQLQPSPSIKKTPSFPEKNTNGINDRPPTPMRMPIPIPPPPPPPPPKPAKAMTAETGRPADSMADAWEKEELANIRDRYEKLKETIDSWEMKKKKKAKRKIETSEGELDKKRQNALRRFHSDIVRIEDIAGGARAKAEENRKNEELKAKEKAKKIRLTGKLPAFCLCF